MFTNDHEEYRNLIHFLESDKDFEFYIIKRNIDKPIKAVIKDLPSSSKTEDMTKDLADEAANCFMKPRCLKCGKEHATKNCHIKDRLTNPFCINCQDFGHSACYTKCPEFPQPKKGTAFTDPIKKKNFVSKWTKEGISFAIVVSEEILSQTPPENNNNKKGRLPR
ncbi:uncharacterized protein TNCV_3610921 [Trichonephila clavipes]|nr:uncharacterized protein TNCV_3610921 [Trichonephila clavipes]